MNTHFFKMNQAGNTYLFFDCFNKTIKNPSEVSKRYADRKKGFATDGIVLLLPSCQADVKMEIYNADGSRGRICGNALCCIGQLLFQKTGKTSFLVETDSGFRSVTVDGSFSHANMGKATHLGTFSYEVEGKTYDLDGVSLGNLHACAFLKRIQTLPLERIGPFFEKNPSFEDGVNTEFGEILSPTEVNMRVYERGSQETDACGSGACALCFAGIQKGLLAKGKTVCVHCRGGDLTVFCDDEDCLTLGGEPKQTEAGEVVI